MGENYKLQFDLSSYATLDELALLARQDYNLGNKGDWFTHFRWGKNGLFARLLGIRLHYYQIHSWELIESLAQSATSYYVLESSLYQMTEYHFSTILFNMDSAIECTVFTLNALGYAANSEQFKDVTNENELKKIRTNKAKQI